MTVRDLDRPFENTLELIGATPMVRLKNVSKDIKAEIWAKLEFFNPSGSIKDRIALRMLEDAENTGRISPGDTIVEPTSGNTGISLAFVCALKGYNMVAVMPDAVSMERRTIVGLFGGSVELVTCLNREKGVTKEDMEEVVRRAHELAESLPNAVMLDQFTNANNPHAHADTTASEIVLQTKGRFSSFVAACGTGGTFSGVARSLKENYPDVRCVVVEPHGSAVLSGCEPGHHLIQGIGEGFIPAVMDMDLVDDIVQVSDKDAIATMRRLWREEGIMAGISAGANVFASLKIGEHLSEGDIIVTVIPDNGMRYLSTTEVLEGC